MSNNTEYRVQPTDSFENQLITSARRQREQSENSLSTPEMIALPPKHTRYWGWIATPAAAAVGLLIGLLIHRPTEPQDNFSVPIVVATDNSGHSIADDGTDYSLLISL